MGMQELVRDALHMLQKQGGLGIMGQLMQDNKYCALGGVCVMHGGVRAQRTYGIQFIIAGENWGEWLMRHYGVDSQQLSSVADAHNCAVAAIQSGFGFDAAGKSYEIPATTDGIALFLELLEKCGFKYEMPPQVAMPDVPVTDAEAVPCA